MAMILLLLMLDVNPDDMRGLCAACCGIFIKFALLSCFESSVDSITLGLGTFTPPSKDSGPPPKGLLMAEMGYKNIRRPPQTHRGQE